MTYPQFECFIYCCYYLWLWLNRNIRSSNRLLWLTAALTTTSRKEIIIIGRLELLMIAHHAGHIHISRCCIEMRMVMMMSGSGAATAAARVNGHIGDDERRRGHLKRRGRYGRGRRGRDRVAVWGRAAGQWRRCRRRRHQLHLRRRRRLILHAAFQLAAQSFERRQRRQFSFYLYQNKYFISFLICT